jgi:hypothetical protein
MIQRGLFGAVILAGLSGFASDVHAAGGDADVIKALSSAKVTLSAGIQQAQAKSPEVSISAKFEMDDKGQLSLSVYTAEKGLAVDAEHNVLKELSGSPAVARWRPEVGCSRTWSTCRVHRSSSRSLLCRSSRSTT